MKTIEMKKNEIKEMIPLDRPLLKKLYLMLNERAEVKSKEREKERKEYGRLLINLLNESEIAKYMPEMYSFHPNKDDPHSSSQYMKRDDGSIKTGLCLLSTEKDSIYFIGDRKLINLAWKEEKYHISYRGDLYNYYGRVAIEKPWKGTIEEICEKEDCKKIFIDVANQIATASTYGSRLVDGNIAHELHDLSKQL